MKVILAQPRGFCAGVDRAIEIVERALQKHGAPIYVRHEIVHNKYVVEDLRTKGAIFVDEVCQVPDGAITIFSAHGVSEDVENQAKQRDLPVIDATCPLVTKVHKEAQRYENDNRQIILIGHDGHPEVEGTSGRVKGGVLLVQTKEDVASLQLDSPETIAYVTQTTLSLDDTKEIIEALKVKYPNIKGPDTRDICYATQNRQNAVKQLTNLVDLMLVIGSTNSSNSNRLRDIALENGIEAYLINGAQDIDNKWLQGKTSIGITAGASAPEILVDQVIDYLKNNGVNTVENFNGIVENTKFKLPADL